MIDCTDTADYAWLTGDEARAILNDIASDKSPLHTSVALLRGKFSAARTHLLIEQVELRRRAAAKFTHPEQMFFTRMGLEQATDEWVAAYKSHRFQRAGSCPTPAFADLCCGIGGDLLAFSKRAAPKLERAGSSPTPALGLDLNPIAAHFAALNSGAPVEIVDVASFDVRSVSAWHIDPDRRATGHRTTSLEYCEPSLADIEQLLARNQHAAIKLAPATKVPADWIARCELEWVSRDRECRQQVAWHGDLALAPGNHRATMLLASRGVPAPGPPRTITGLPNQPTSIVATPHAYIFDTDPAVRAAHLTGALAAEHDLAALSAGPTYLTGPHAIADPALACFEVDDVLPLRERTLADALRHRHVGRLEIKSRGVDIVPEKLRRDLKLRGDQSASLLITKIAGRPTAILARRV